MAENHSKYMHRTHPKPRFADGGAPALQDPTLAPATGPMTTTGGPGNEAANYDSYHEGV